MENKQEILRELKELFPSLAELQKTVLYSVPPEYFNKLPNEILDKVQEGQLPLKLCLKKNPYSLPNGYFETLTGKIMSEIRGRDAVDEVFEETERLAPILNTIEKRIPYGVPHLYFETLASQPQTFLPLRQPKKTILRMTPKLLRYASAAVFLGITSMIFFFSERQNKNNSRINLTTHHSVQKLSEQEIITFLKTSAPTENLSFNAAVQNSKNSKINISVSKIPDEEIKQFLRENGVEVEM